MFVVGFCVAVEVRCDGSSSTCNIFVDDVAYGCSLARDPRASRQCNITAAGMVYNCDSNSPHLNSCSSNTDQCVLSAGLAVLCVRFFLVVNFFFPSFFFFFCTATQCHNVQSMDTRSRICTVTDAGIEVTCDVSRDGDFMRFSRADGSSVRHANCTLIPGDSCELVLPDGPKLSCSAKAGGGDCTMTETECIFPDAMCIFGATNSTIKWV